MERLFEDPERVGFAEVEKTVMELGAGGCARTSVAGWSVCGRAIYAVTIGAMHNPSIFVGGTHGMEWASVLTALKFACELKEHVDNDMCACGISLREAVSRRGVVIVPLLNPDGFELRRRGPAAAGRARVRALARFSKNDFAYWQSNARGVDINRNFNAGFGKARRAAEAVGIRRAAPTRYGGPFAMSEPETRAIARLCAKCRPRSLFALHSQGEEIYWRYGDRLPAGSAYIAKTLSSLSGYELAAPDSIASHAGLKDWFIKRYDRPGFTIELGLGKNPLPYSDFDAIYNKIRRALFVASVI